LETDGFVVATLHRPSNVDDAASLETCLRGLAAIARDRPVVFPLHPRTAKQVEAFGLGEILKSLRVTEPLGYVEMLSLVESATATVTDSGGVQEETTALGVTLREQTERPVTVSEGTNTLAPWPLTVEGIRATYDKAARQGRVGVGARAPEGWDGRAAERVVAALAS
jgi:UDP-N-acetylglucosamine 2-epimerase (non-hydrolysing)